MLFVTSLLLVYIHLFLDDDDDGVFLKVSIVLPYSSRLISPSLFLSLFRSPLSYIKSYTCEKIKYTDNTSRPIYP